MASKPERDRQHYSRGHGRDRSRLLGWQRDAAGSMIEEDENLHDWIRGLLEPDERLILPEDYVNHWTMYDQICGSAYFIKDDNAADPNAIDFVWENDLRRMKKSGKNMDKITVVNKVMIVRLRTPWSTVNTEWLITDAELEEYGEDLEILEVYIRARRKDRPNEEPKLFLSHESRRVYEAAPEDYEVTEKKYLVAWKMSPETREALLR